MIFVVGIVAFVLCVLSFATWAICTIFEYYSAGEFFLKGTLSFAMTSLISMLFFVLLSFISGF